MTTCFIKEQDAAKHLYGSASDYVGGPNKLDSGNHKAFIIGLLKEVAYFVAHIVTFLVLVECVVFWTSYFI